MSMLSFLGAPRAAGAWSIGQVSRAGLGHYNFGWQATRALSTVTARYGHQCHCRPFLGAGKLTLRSGEPIRRISSTAVRFSASPAPAPTPPPKRDSDEAKSVAKDEEETELHESPYTLPNALTVARIAACPFLAWSIVKGDFALATGILVGSGLTDWLDGYLARKWNQKSVLGSILDPMADKTLVTTLVVLCRRVLTPVPLALLIFGRDFGLSMWAFYLRYKSLPPPRTIKRYFDPTMPSAEVKPTQISKVNTALQLFLMGFTTVSPLLTSVPYLGEFLTALQWTVAGTTIWSGLSYIGTSGFKILKQPRRKLKP